MDFTPRAIDPADEARYVREGFWREESLGELLAAGMADAAAQPFTIRSAVRPYRGTLGDIDAMARRVATGMRARGIGPGDVVSFQLPNSAEAAVVFYAATYLGAVVAPIVHFYGPKEVSYILGRTRVKAFITADRFGHQDFIANLDGMRADLPDLEWVAIVGETGGRPDLVPYAELLTPEPLAAPVPVDPRTPALIGFTSGTTANPKGVVHSHRTINAEIHQLAPMQLTEARGGVPFLTGAPVSHAIGMLAALLLPVFRRSSIHLIDVWDPAVVLQAMLDDGLSAGQGSTFFLLSLLDHPDFDPVRHGRLMPFVGLGGSAVPAAIGERCAALGIETSRSFGCTEHPSITGSVPGTPQDKRLHTDGAALPGVEIRTVDEDGNDVAPGEPGEIWSKGPDCFIGYIDDAETAAAFTGDGWFTTGDIGVLDDDGYLTITDRKKDIIIRGGTNVSPAEVEELLIRMPGVAEVAVVGAPDPRLGEVGCAFFRMQVGADVPSLDAVRRHLDAAGLARQKWPEQIRSVTDFPRTPSGKVQKFVLRAEVRAVEVGGAPTVADRS